MFRRSIARPVSVLTRRFVHYTRDWESLAAQVAKPPTDGFNDFAVTAFKQAQTIQSHHTAANDAEFSADKNQQFCGVLDTMFAAGQLQEPLLRELLLLYPSTPVALHLIRTFYHQNPQGVIPRDTALIALRTALWNGDIKNALTVSDITVGHPSYIAAKNAELKKGFTKLVATSVGITLFSKYGVDMVIDAGLLSDSWRHLSALNSVILTYFLNSSFFITVVKLGRQLVTAGGDYLTWQKGTFYTTWFKHADEMMFCAKIVDADRDLNQGENNPELMAELCRTNDDIFSHPHTLTPGYARDGSKIRSMAAKDNLGDLMMQAYWMSGGDGFEWVEPDQDPAELMWQRHLASFNKEQIKAGDDVKQLFGEVPEGN
ncbi:hypothetical protein DICA3_E16688 [Diutina catenulata]